jgi:hypothetical protein
MRVTWQITIMPGDEGNPSVSFSLNWTVLKSISPIC